MAALAPPLHLTVRRLRSADADQVEAAFAALSPETRYLRFGTPLRDPAIALRWISRLDEDADVAVGGFDDTGRLIGLARYVVTAPAVAEIAETVIDLWQGRGAGRRLLCELVDEAAAAGLVELRASVLFENRRANELLRSCRWQPLAWSGGLIEYRLVLDPAPLPA